MGAFHLLEDGLIIRALENFKITNQNISIPEISSDIGGVMVCSHGQGVNHILGQIHWYLGENTVFHCPMSVFYCPMSVFHYPMSDYHCPMLVFHCPILVFH